MDSILIEVKLHCLQLETELLSICVCVASLCSG